MTITTPTTAVLARKLSKAQRDAIRLGYQINDYPYQPDRTYIVFDATVVVNKLHIDIGASGNYFVNEGNGNDELPFNDTGGVKDLTYETAGRYLITIRGNFQGIEVSGAQSERDKYIEIYAGNNYPSSIAVNAFYESTNLEKISFTNVTSINSAAFRYCSSLNSVVLPIATSFFDSCFANCANMESVYAPALSTIANGVFDQDSRLIEICLKSISTIGFNSFRGCVNLHELDLFSCTSVGDNCFSGCVNLRKMSLEYNASFSAGSTAFINVKLSDLYVKNANSTEAVDIDTDLSNANMTKLNGYRLIY